MEPREAERLVGAHAVGIVRIGNPRDHVVDVVPRHCRAAPRREVLAADGCAAEEFRARCVEIHRAGRRAQSSRLEKHLVAVGATRLELLDVERPRRAELTSAAVGMIGAGGISRLVREPRQHDQLRDEDEC